MVTWVPGYSVLHRFGQHVRRVVADHAEGVGVFRRVTKRDGGVAPRS